MLSIYHTGKALLCCLVLVCFGWHDKLVKLFGRGYKIRLIKKDMEQLSIFFPC